MAEEVKATQLNSLALAFLGDAVYELEIRRRALADGKVKLHELNQATVAYVSADAQAAAYFKLEAVLDEEERGVLYRGRNARSRHFSRGSSVADYRHATALEALMGYLYLQNRSARITELVDMIWKENGGCDDESDTAKSYTGAG